MDTGVKTIVITTTTGTDTFLQPYYYGLSGAIFDMDPFQHRAGYHEVSARLPEVLALITPRKGYSGVRS